MSFGGNRKMPAPPRHPTPPFNNLHPHDRKNTAVMGISISHMRNQSSGNHPGEQISSLHCVSINNTTIYSNEPVRVRPNPRPQKGVVRSGLVWFRKNKSNKNTIHESINTTPLSRNNPCTHHRSPARSINHNHSSSRYYLEPTPNPEASPK